jgi:NADP-dependent 3-hydroxy acid dehydrogenase YdfG
MSLASLPLALKRILLTGASSGIGWATALALAEAGATVVATGRRQDRLTVLREAGSSLSGSIETIAGDLNQPAFIGSLAERAGSVDILVNNAGQLSHAPFLESDPVDWETVFQTNVFAVLRLTQLIARNMVAAGAGHIINVTSVLAREVTPYTLVYAASKHAQRAIGEGLRVELRQHGIKVTDVLPGLVTTEINRGITHPLASDYYIKRSEKFPYLEPSDIAAAILFACSASPNAAPEVIEINPARRF